MLNLFAAVLTVSLLFMLWQQWRYLRVRRDLAQDMQRLLHPVDAFHLIVFFKLKSGSKLVDTAQQYAQQVVSDSKVRLIYAGQAAFTASSQQLGERNWDGVLLFEYPSRASYEASRNKAAGIDARAVFADSYIHGMRRNRAVSASVPNYLLQRRIKNVLTGKWRLTPLTASPQFETAPELQVWRTRVSRLHALHKVNREGLVVFNLVKYTAAGHQAAIDSFDREMLSRMAAMTYGLLHIGRSVALEEFARFDRVFVMYYPSARYFADLLASQYFQSFTGSLLPGDTLRVPTVPITERLHLQRTAT